jgi:hypothetical protein
MVMYVMYALYFFFGLVWIGLFWIGLEWIGLVDRIDLDCIAM